MSLVKTMKDEPAHTVLVFLIASSAAAAIALGALMYLPRGAVAVPPVPLRSSLHPPAKWLTAAKEADVMTVRGRHVYYFGKPRGAKNPTGSYYKSVHYSGDSDSAKPFRSVILHYTRSRPELDQDYYATILTRIQHEGSRERKGSLGYHFYVTSDGRILQGAPLSVRTNHIMPRGSSVRSKEILPDADNDNSVGVSAVGGWAPCPNQPITSNCAVWKVTAAQERAMVDLQRDIKSRFAIPCDAVAGHGEVQPGSRNEVEGAELARKIRSGCCELDNLIYRLVCLWRVKLHILLTQWTAIRDGARTHP